MIQVNILVLLLSLTLYHWIMHGKSRPTMVQQRNVRDRWKGMWIIDWSYYENWIKSQNVGFLFCSLQSTFMNQCLRLNKWSAGYSSRFGAKAFIKETLPPMNATITPKTISKRLVSRSILPPSFDLSSKIAGKIYVIADPITAPLNETTKPAFLSNNDTPVSPARIVAEIRRLVGAVTSPCFHRRRTSDELQARNRNG